MRAAVPTPAIHPKSETRPNSPPVFVLRAGGERSISSDERRYHEPDFFTVTEGYLLRHHPVVVSGATRSQHVLTVPAKQCWPATGHSSLLVAIASRGYRL